MLETQLGQGQAALTHPHKPTGAPGHPWRLPPASGMVAPRPAVSADSPGGKETGQQGCQEAPGLRGRWVGQGRGFVEHGFVGALLRLT